MTMLRKWIGITGSLLLIFIVAAQIRVAAESNPQPVSITLPANQTIDHDYFAGGNDVTILGTINGDVYTAGGNITVLGKVNGDLLAAGGNITIDGDVTQDVRAAGGTIHIGGTVGRNVSVAGGTLEIASNAHIGHNLTAAGGQMTILAPIPGDLNFAGGTISLGERVGGNATGYVGNLTLLPKALIEGNLTYTSSQPVNMASKSSVQGKVAYITPAPQQKKAEESSRNIASGIIAFMATIKFISLISSLIVGFLLLSFIPFFVKAADTTLTTRPWGSFGLGIVAALVFPMIFIILLITVIGIPIAFVALGIYLLLLYFAKLLTIIIIGKKLVNLVSPKKGYFWGLVIGAIVYELITFITPINFFIAIITYAIGLGALLLTKRNYYLDLHTKKLL